MISNSVILVTGSRKGIGRYLAEYYLTAGNVVIGCSREKSDLMHENYHHFMLNVADEIAIKGMFSSVRKKFGQIDILINNAGIASMNAALLTPASTVSSILNTNVLGTFLVCREAAKLMIKKGYGRIVNFTTVAAPLNLEGEAVYAASKEAVKKLSQVLSRELGSYGITVNTIGPTPIETDLIRSVPPEKISNLVSRQSITRLGKFEDVSNVIDFFVSPESSFITGQTIYLGGVG